MYVHTSSFRSHGVSAEKRRATPHHSLTTNQLPFPVLPWSACLISLRTETGSPPTTAVCVSSTREDSPRASSPTARAGVGRARRLLSAGKIRPTASPTPDTGGRRSPSPAAGAAYAWCPPKTARVTADKCCPRRSADSQRSVWRSGHGCIPPK